MREARDEYNTMMLWMIAQPTRKHPDKLPKFEAAVKMDANRAAVRRTAGSIMEELMTHGNPSHDGK